MDDESKPSLAPRTSTTFRHPKTSLSKQLVVWVYFNSVGTVSQRVKDTVVDESGEISENGGFLWYCFGMPRDTADYNFAECYQVGRHSQECLETLKLTENLTVPVINQLLYSAVHPY